MYPQSSFAQTKRSPKSRRSLDDLRSRAAGGLADSLAANPFGSQPNPARDASRALTGRSLAGLQGAQTALAAPGFGGAAPTGLNALIADADNRAGVMSQNVAGARTLGQLAASSQGWTDHFGVTTRGGVGTAGPSMGNQDAITAGLARPAGPIAKVGLGRVSTPMHAQGVTRGERFSPSDDPAHRSLFEEAKAKRAHDHQSARSMRQQRAQWRMATGNHLGNPMFDESGRIDQLGTIVAQNMGNPAVAANAIATQRRLSQLASDSQSRNTLEKRKLAELEAAGAYNRSDEYRQHALKMAGIEDLDSTEDTSRNRLDETQARRDFEDQFPDTPVSDYVNATARTLRDHGPDSSNDIVDLSPLTPQQLDAMAADMEPGLLDLLFGTSEEAARRRQFHEDRRTLNDAMGHTPKPAGTYDPNAWNIRVSGGPGY